eukprot:scaffold3079_cov174-Amphora_coffeaeformis.AAC.17
MRQAGAPPALVESPESTTDRPAGKDDQTEDDPLLELNEEGNNWIVQSILQASDVIWTAVKRITKSETDRRRYVAGGLVLAYILLLYLCSWTVTPTPYGVCPSDDESLAISVAWRLSRSPRPPETCFTNPEIDQMLQDREIPNNKTDGIRVRLTRPVTFLSAVGRHAAASKDSEKHNNSNNNNSSSNNQTGNVYSLSSKMGIRHGTQGESASRFHDINDDARWVSLLPEQQRTYNPMVAIWRFILRYWAHPRRLSDEVLLEEIVNHPFTHAFSQEPLLSSADMDFLEAWSNRLTSESSDWRRRVARVAWGGRSKWWHPVFPRSSYYPLETIDGANLLYPYFQAMQPYMRDIDHVRFSRRPCSSGCNTQVGILSSLEWRESYSPWMVTAEVLEENEDGWVYAHGMSKPSPFGRHGIVWLRIGKHSIKDSQAYTRAIINSVDRAIGDALRQGRAGRVNLVVDAEGYEWGKLPNFHDIKELFGLLQDHYPGRFGAAFLFNMSPSAEILFSLLKPLLGKQVLEKIYFLSSDPKERNKQLETVIPSEYMPSWMGGSDPFEFSTRSYYARRFIVDQK